MLMIDQMATRKTEKIVPFRYLSTRNTRTCDAFDAFDEFGCDDVRTSNQKVVKLPPLLISFVLKFVNFYVCLSSDLKLVTKFNLVDSATVK